MHIEASQSCLACLSACVAVFVVWSLFAFVFVSAPAWGSNGGTSSGSAIGTANCIGKHVVQSVVALVLAEYHANL